MVSGQLQYFQNGQPVKNTFINSNGQTYYYDGNGNRGYGSALVWNHWRYFDPQTGAQVKSSYETFNGQTYYYDSTGCQVYGSQLINNHWQYFDNHTGAQYKSAYVTSGGHTFYYDQNGNQVYGPQYLYGHNQYFDPHTGIQARNTFMNQNGKTVYYDGNGNQAFGKQFINGKWYVFDNTAGAMDRNVTVTIGRQTLYIGGDGVVYGVYNDANVICQRPELMEGCEITAVTMMLQYGGYNVNKMQLAGMLPRSSNPNTGFVGALYQYSPAGGYVYPGGVAPVVTRIVGHSDIMTGSSMEAIKDKLCNGHLVVAWMGNMDGFEEHAITITGINGNTVYYNDPWIGAKETMSMNDFYYHWNACGERMLSY